MNRLRAAACLLAVAGGAALGAEATYRDGHARPRALALDPRTGLVWAALSTADAVVAIDPATRRVVQRRRTCRFPAALAATERGLLVACRFDADLRLLTADGARAIPAGPERGHAGLAVGARVAYVASPPLRGVKVVALDGRGVLEVVPTGISPRRLRLIDDPRGGGRLLLVANTISRTVTVHPVGVDERLGPPIQTIATDAPVDDLLVVPGRGLVLLTHEDAPIDRAGDEVHGLDSVALVVPPGRAWPFDDPGPGRRRASDLTERTDAPLAKLDAIALAPDGRLAIVGAATDDALLLPPGADLATGGRVVAVGASPADALFLPDGRLVTADRLSDTLTFVDPDGGTEAVVVGEPRRPTPAERGELLFYTRALVPHNRADGPRSIYACSACHPDGHIDGRRHAARRNRFRSMTKTCRGLADTAPYLSLGELDSLDEFADNIIATHAQGRAAAPDTFDRYAVELSIAGAKVRLEPAQVRAAMAAYLARIPLEASPFPPDPLAAAGAALFRRGCTGCHRPPTFTSRGRHDVGTPVLGDGGNNPPSLRGVWDAAPYFSDGSAASLEDVLRRTDPGAPEVHAAGNAAHPRFSDGERRALAAFLKGL